MELLDSDKFVCHCVFNFAVGKLVFSFVSSIPTGFLSKYIRRLLCTCLLLCSFVYSVLISISFLDSSHH